MINTTFYLLIIPDNFTLKVKGTYHDPIVLDIKTFLSKVKLLKIKSKIKIVKSLSKNNIKTKFYDLGSDIERICTTNLTIYQYIEYLAGIVPIATGYNITTVATSGILHIYPYFINNISIFLQKTLIGDINNILKNDEYLIFSYNPPPGSPYECCGISYNASETISRPASCSNVGKALGLDSNLNSSYIIVEFINELNKILNKYNLTTYKNFKYIEFLNRKYLIYNFSIIVPDELKLEPNITNIYIKYSCNNFIMNKSELIFHSVYGFLIKYHTNDMFNIYHNIINFIGTPFIKKYLISYNNLKNSDYLLNFTVTIIDSDPENIGNISEIFNTIVFYPASFNATLDVWLVEVSVPPPAEVLLVPSGRGVPWSLLVWFVLVGVVILWRVFD